ncbi:MAG: glutamate N-acetyltransferase / amino-acid N-acetyltransferase [Solirubrobacterales bacterium]|jgi:glutamate N-acetyltransferase/amino-acid N-acetyltransferase|nr:glutamate N-acetyltransferase / amino-acid N-acetyltransferase [Solirubrobacterales bacterium]
MSSLFDKRWVRLPRSAEELDPSVLAPGFRAGATNCGLKDGGETDVAVLVCDASEVVSSVLLTKNAAAAAPIRVCRENIDAGAVRAIAVNSGNANAATGEQGFKDALEMQSATADALGLDSREVVVAETGVIGVPLEIDRVTEGVRHAANSLARDRATGFTRAIMTTDRSPKNLSVKVGGVTVSAQAKGAGMIQPGFATMLCFVQTDAQIPDPDGALRHATDRSFERITVDGQMSTNDTIVLQATGETETPMPTGLLDSVLLALALEIVADGEGAERIGRVEVTKARDPGEAERVARAIANSPLVKTALTGRDANWGRIAQAAGMALAGEEMPEPGPHSISYQELGAETDEAEIGIALGRGDASAHVYFSDLTHEYIHINAEYTT